MRRPGQGIDALSSNFGDNLVTHRILVVDDEPQMRLAMTRVLTRAGYGVEAAGDGLEALEIMKKETFPVIISDVRMPKLDGTSFLQRARALSPRSAVLMITAYGTVESAVEAVRSGARDYILKPFPPEVLERSVEEAIRAGLGVDVSTGAAPAMGVHQGPVSSAIRTILTKDPVMTGLLERARRAAASDATVLIQAESGAGKELLARLIHHQSPRRGGPFAAINCAAFPHDLLESELFGHARGAFTGAVRERRGHIEVAGGGTLLLDEIGEMSPPLQAKLLRVLQEREIQRLGEESPRRVDVRVIASTNRDLGASVRNGSFREDLYFRLSVIPLRIPPLRERPADIPLLLEYFCRLYSPGSSEVKISKEASRALAAHAWPGNVRELENVVHRAVVMGMGPELTVRDFFPEDVPERKSSTRETWLCGTIAEAEKLLIEAALERTKGNRTQAAAMVGISVRTLRNKLRDYRRQGESFAAPLR